MDPIARYHDGTVASARVVTFAISRPPERQELIIADPDTYDEIDRWPIGDIFEVPGRRGELKLGVEGRPYGARLRLTGKSWVDATRKLIPGLVGKARGERGQQLKILGIATGALVSVIVAYVVGVPLLASRIVPLVPPSWEAGLGETALEQINGFIAPDGMVELCDSNPNSLANRAIDQFARDVLAGTGSPFTPDIKVVYSGIPNAFALPGGHSYYFSSLLAQTETPDEFAGVMAHELGHVLHRHGLEGLISSSATGLLVGFVLGDMTGLSVAGGLGAAMIDTRFSRDAERQADAFAGATAARLGFDPAALANLLERVAGDDDAGRMLQIFSSHPLTTDRRAALEAMPKPPAGRQVFSDAEWQAIKAMCGAPKTDP
jgi:predicted Zn-dependent protease